MFFGKPRCRWLSEHAANDADMSELLRFISSVGGTTCQLQMSRSTKLVSSWCQGVGGLNKGFSTGQGLGGSLDTWSTSLTRQNYYHSSPVSGEPRPSQPASTNVRFVGVGQGTRQWQGVAGIVGRSTSRSCVVDSHLMLPVMPRRLDTHRSAWISQQPRQSAEFAPLQSVA